MVFEVLDYLLRFWGLVHIAWVRLVLVKRLLQGFSESFLKLSDIEALFLSRNVVLVAIVLGLVKSETILFRLSRQVGLHTILVLHLQRRI